MAVSAAAKVNNPDGTLRGVISGDLILETISKNIESIKFGETGYAYIVDKEDGTVVAHKTGSSDTNDKGITAATNDIGIITLPNGKHFAIAVYVSDSSEKSDVNEKIIAEICKSVWDYLVKSGK